ncbi:MAG: GH1 family beta-glucosidase [Gemmatimonadales bacterium]
MSYRFPTGFLWGAATSAYQIEGSPLLDGSGENIWHRFSHTPGRTSNGDTGDVACDHYRRWRDDLDLMGELGLSAYRFSIAWCRVLPRGTGPVNPPGLGFYDRLVDGLLERRIRPCVTLYHWDLPAALDERGGWLNHDSAYWFADYARVVVDKLGDRVPLWATLNEPWVIAVAGYLTGAHPPGHASVPEAALAAHNLLRAHGAAVQVVRASGRGQLGLVVNLEPKIPATDRLIDAAAARRADAFMNRHFLDPVFLGQYPHELHQIYGPALPELKPEDLALIRQPLDWLGINYYTRAVTRDDPAAEPVRASMVPQPGQRYTALGWEVHPAALTDVLLWVRDRYGGLPLYLTENGAAFDDPPAVRDKLVDDPLRVEYYRDHLRAAHEAIRKGANLRGYFAWSLLDNFEWSHGYSKRFGLYHVDFETLARTPKASARFYADVIATHGESLGR